MSPLHQDDLDPPLDDEDERVSRRGGGMDAGTRQLAMIAGGIGAVLIAVVGGWSLLGHHQNGIPVIQAPPGPVRVKPVNPGGMQMSGPQAIGPLEGGAQSLAPGPEAPRLDALKAEMGGEPSGQDKAPSPAAPLAGSSPAPAEPADDRSASGAGEDGSTSDRAAAAPASSGAVPPPVPPARMPAPAAAPAEGTAAALGGRYAVQLAALGSQQAADAEWSRLQKQVPELLGDKAHNVTVVTRDGHSFFRLRTPGFPSIAAANAFCQQLRARGVACTPADF
ncbi:SPOR domain-containing protein [Rhizosaccharibacter radicis]|uniref:SPOR domain-containing protein n=1 Tax=Rhizosaccharibacter radicis TaxID=2782605 RepID=A0ABT1VYY8_9PROT|nr:SPOR domain-containing protein [Acetobacteraceae bacterium KSS12]